MRGALAKVSRFLPDGRLKTKYQERLDAASLGDRRTGGLKHAHEDALQKASKVDRVTGLPKDPT